MFRHDSPVNLTLGRDDLIAWNKPHAATLHVVSGGAWVTQSNDPVDHFLHAGQSLALQPGAQVLISALEAVSVRVHAHVSGPGAWALSLWHRVRTGRKPSFGAVPSCP